MHRPVYTANKVQNKYRSRTEHYVQRRLPQLTSNLTEKTQTIFTAKVMANKPKTASTNK